MPSLSEVVSYTDRFLRIRDVGDWDNALNGLQIENSGRITRIGAAVDGSTRVLTEAQKRDIDFLIVHHGLFWPGLQPIRGTLRRQLRIAFENDVALYSAHLPLDIHPKVGNNAQLVGALGLPSGVRGHVRALKSGDPAFGLQSNSRNRSWKKRASRSA